ncbi:MAG TPA: hypothetical protein VN622_14775 [Clostridia bacterium]|nr:hypothetical protein [Clostridia bacterium]
MISNIKLICIALAFLVSAVFSGSAAAWQASPAVPVKKPASTQARRPAKSPAKNRAVKLDPKQQFVLDVVRSAVALPQPDPQDRLRVLQAAANVVGTFRPALAKHYAREGLRIEQELIQQGASPSASLLEHGHVDCGTVADFIDNIPTTRVPAAEQSLVGAISFCPKQATEPARRKLQAAMDEGHVAPRALLAMIERVGAKTPWSQEQFARLFSSLPGDANAARAEAPNFAAMYSRMAPVVDKPVARSAGIKFLLWLGKLDDSGERSLAVNIAAGSMQEALGEKEYEAALASDVMARQVAQGAGQAGEVEHPEEENVSVLQAMDSKSEDRTADLEKLPASLRAREAAASGFATGTDGNSKLADRYFDLAFSALNDVWQDRSATKDAPDIVQEVSEAAAQVDAVDALKRAQNLQDQTAQAIAMIAVARVAANRQEAEPASTPGKSAK